MPGCDFSPTKKTLNLSALKTFVLDIRAIFKNDPEKRIYAARMDYQNCEADVGRLAAILEHHPLFVARKYEIISLINKFVNAMKAGDPDKALDAAADALTSEQKNTAFELAVEAVRPEKELAADKKRAAGYAQKPVVNQQ